MALVDKLKQQALAQAEKHSGEWLDKAIEKGREQLQPGTTFGLVGGQALKALEEHKGELAQLGPEGLQVVMTYVATERYDEATLLFLRETAGWNDLHDASAGLSAATNDETRKREATKKNAVDLLKKIGSATARALLPILLTVL